MSRRADKGRIYGVADSDLAKAHSLHLDGMSARAIARTMLAEGIAYAASEKSLTMSLTNAWRARGWEVRSQQEATAQANRDRAFRPQCSHIHQAGPRKGQQCARRCVGNDATCWKHDPDRIAAALDRLRSAA